MDQVAGPSETLTECGGGSGVRRSGGMIGWREDEGVCHHAPSSTASHITQREREKKKKKLACTGLTLVIHRIVKASHECVDFILHH